MSICIFVDKMNVFISQNLKKVGAAQTLISFVGKRKHSNEVLFVLSVFIFLLVPNMTIIAMMIPCHKVQPSHKQWL